MGHYIMDNNDLQLNIDVYFVPDLEAAAATKITPIYRDDGTIDDQALADIREILKQGDYSKLN